MIESLGGRWGPIVVAAVSAIVVAAAGAWLTTLGPWYRSLRVPSWKPPDWAFGPVWTTIFTLTAIAGVLAWNAAPEGAERFWLLAAFAVNGVLNIAWSGVFFRLQRPDWALIEVVALWLSVALLILAVGRHSGLGALLLAPYLVWVGTAAMLNWSIVRLNGPF
ncbi:tryptophan-rich sensory protein [Methylobacterium currus]|uniref:Tryptophan-rich sensory protein n=1 Tax=Methylobacterium currus TaxID=2051553 RepID=A0A2R4WF94_9HYPH|nr:TspO/MBR family protein [Methylobacterium currus]AWB20198.1 tryptophan-rich sensory protein [Methylobacterium currus]UHC15051.1 tryptophan-rich sensory protein [Methylobacterium currus]